MHIWTITKWEKYYPDNLDTRKGLRLKFDKEVDPEVRRACKEFCHWLRSEYYFPIRVPIYLKASKKIRACDGDAVYGTFFEPYNRDVEPYIRIATGDYQTLLKRMTKDSALATILSTIAHELTHYFQWINDIKLTEIGQERQATNYTEFIMDEYKETRDHP